MLQGSILVRGVFIEDSDVFHALFLCISSAIHAILEIL